jgi:hypothetical protein
MKETVLKLRATIPLIDLEDDYFDEGDAEFIRGMRKRAIAEIIGMAEIMARASARESIQDNFMTVQELGPSEIKKDPALPSLDYGDGPILSFSQNTNYDLQAIKSKLGLNNIPLPEIDMADLMDQSFGYMMKKRIINILLAANIAKPGSLGIETGAIFINGHFSTGFDHFNCDYVESDDYYNPLFTKLRELSVAQTWIWLNSIEGAGLYEGNGQLGRAIAALSYTLGPASSNHYLQMIWALLGLEAIYAPKEQMQQTQLMTNISRLLGKDAVIEELLDRLYRDRTRFVHGRMDFPFAHAELDPPLNDDDEEDEGEFVEAVNYGLNLLLTSLQELAAREQVVPPFGSRK